MIRGIPDKDPPGAMPLAKEIGYVRCAAEVFLAFSGADALTIFWSKFQRLEEIRFNVAAKMMKLLIL